MRVRFGVLPLAAVAVLAAVGSGPVAAAGLKPCGSNDERSCLRVTVPLDRAGTVPGTVPLHVERQEAERATRPPLFLFADLPGGSAARSFNGEIVTALIGLGASSRDVVVMDLRGTGESGPLRCPALHRVGGWPSAIGGCVAKLGQARDFYTAVDMADDIDAVRAALGAERIAAYGIAYGAHVAQAYARRHPGRVERLVLDSVGDPQGVDALDRSSMAATPRLADSICEKRQCRGFTRDAGRDFARLAARLERRPLAGLVTDSDGRRRRASIDGYGLFYLAAMAESDFFLAPEIPAAVHNALRGDAAPLLRTYARARSSADLPLGPPESFSGLAYVAAMCSEARLPWDESVPLDRRPAAADALIGSLPASAFAPFGPRTARRADLVRDCLSWPSSTVQRPELGPLPDVPALLLAGRGDVRAPVESARALAARLPRSELVVRDNLRHDVMAWGYGECERRAVSRFLVGKRVGVCAELSRPKPWQPAPTRLSDLPAKGRPGGRVGRTLAAVELTLADGFNTLNADGFAYLIDLDGPYGRTNPRTVGALRGGTYGVLEFGIVYRRAALLPGVRVSGTLRDAPSGLLRGTLRVAGRGAAHGRLELRRGILSGRLGGRRVTARIPRLHESARTLLGG